MFLCFDTTKITKSLAEDVSTAFNLSADVCADTSRQLMCPDLT